MFYHSHYTPAQPLFHRCPNLFKSVVFATLQYHLQLHHPNHQHCQHHHQLFYHHDLFCLIFGECEAKVILSKLPVRSMSVLLLKLISKSNKSDYLTLEVSQRTAGGPSCLLTSPINKKSKNMNGIQKFQE